MPEYSQPLGDAVKQARNRLGLTQSEVAGTIHIDGRTVLNIENRKGNPKMEVLFPLIRVLKIDPCDIFYPETKRSSPAIKQLRILVEKCSEQEAEALIPVIETVLSVLRSKSAVSIESKSLLL